MDIQLELLPYYYYNTLGFDTELIDYMDHVDDSIVLKKISPLYKEGGRPPIDPRVCFGMHYLYFTRPEISSFRELERQLKEPKNQAWRNFIGAPNIEKVPTHSSLSNFPRLQASTPDRFGLMSMGISTNAALAPIKANVLARKHTPIPLFSRRKTNMRARA